MVIQERGGYCLEQNLFFAAILERLGFSIRRLAARVRHRTTKVLPRTHMLLMVRIEERDWLVDVGFGGEGLLQPVPFGTGEISRQFAWTYRVIEVDGEWVLESRRGETWAALYSFTLTPQDIADFEMANHYVATHPDSRFVQTLTVQLPTPEVRYVLRNYELMLDKGDEVATQRITDHDRLLELLASRFGLRLPAGTRIPLTAESG
jgi:N-hydroxyarylamine O-acetyltransferase